MRNEPIDIYADNGALTDRMTGVRFQAKEGLIVVHAETLSPANIQKTEMLYSVFNSIRVMPFSFTERSPFNFYNSLDRKEFEYKINFFTEDFNFAIPGVEYVNTKEIAE